MQFQADPKVAQIAEAYAVDFVDMARADYAVTLDFGLSGIDSVERIADHIASSKPRVWFFRRHVSEKTDLFAKMIGFYVAETLLRAWSGQHGWVHDSGRADIWRAVCGWHALLARGARTAANYRGSRV